MAVIRPFKNTSGVGQSVQETEMRWDPKVPPRDTEPFLEVDLATELQQPRVDDRVRVAPARAVGASDGPNIAGVHQVVGVEVDLEPEPAVVDDLAGTDIESADPLTVQLIIPYHRHHDAAAATG